MKVAILVLVAIIGCQAAVDHDKLHNEWANFQELFDKTYKSPVELRKRFATFAENLEKIEAHNALYEQGLVSWKMGVNRFSDWTNEEFEAYVNKFKYQEDKTPSLGTFRASPVSDAPASVDWRQQGAVAEVKNQGACGSCWSFSTTGALEGLMKIKYNTLISLSEQNLIDCAVQPNYTNFGCSGGVLPEAMRYVQEHGIVSEQEYPYEGAVGTCRQQRVVFQISGRKSVQSNEEALRQAVAVQPISVAIESTSNLQSYHSGVLYDTQCTNKLNHGVLVVGYGNENGQDYWLVKNSWGSNWGENGYFKLARNKGNNCGIALSAYFPVL